MVVLKRDETSINDHTVKSWIFSTLWSTCTPWLCVKPRLLPKILDQSTYCDIAGLRHPVYCTNRYTITTEYRLIMRCLECISTLVYYNTGKVNYNVRIRFGPYFCKFYNKIRATWKYFVKIHCFHFFFFFVRRSHVFYTSFCELCLYTIPLAFTPRAAVSFSSTTYWPTSFLYICNIIRYFLVVKFTCEFFAQNRLYSYNNNENHHNSHHNMCFRNYATPHNRFLSYTSSILTLQHIRCVYRWRRSRLNVENRNFLWFFFLPVYGLRYSRTCVAQEYITENKKKQTNNCRIIINILSGWLANISTGQQSSAVCVCVCCECV